MFNSLFNGTAWSLGLSWLSRLIGLFSVIIVARILTPEDYGIVAIAMIVMHFLQNLSSAGTSQYLIQKKDLDDEDIRTTWTLTVIFRFLACSILFLLSGFLAEFFDEQRLENVFKLLAFVPMFDSIKNINIFIEEKNINYKPIFLLGLSRKIFSFICAVFLALSGYNYWSLIIGEVVGCLIFVFCSYIFLPVRFHLFKPCLSRAAQQLNFYSWSFLQVFVGFSKSKIDGFLMAKYVGSTGMGEYHISSSLADMPSNELATPVTRPLYSGLAAYSSNSSEQITLFYKSLAALSFTVFFLSFGLASTSVEVVSILLGAKWQSIPLIVSILSASYAMYASGTLLSKLLTVQAKVKEVFWLDLYCLILVVMVIGGVAVIFQSLLAITYARFGTSLLVMFFTVFYASKYTNLDIIKVFKVIMPSFIIGLLSSIIAFNLIEFSSMPSIVTFFFKGFLYLILFIGGLLLWSIFCKFENYELIFIRSAVEMIKNKYQGN